MGGGLPYLRDSEVPKEDLGTCFFLPPGPKAALGTGRSPRKVSQMDE